MPAIDPRLVLRQPNHDRASEAHERDIADVRALLSSLPETLGIENVPACIAGARARPEPATADASVLGPDGRLVMTAFTQRFVEDGFYTKPVRCNACVKDASCRGVHVNWVRAHGFGAIEPIRGA
jgi:hypothetical protein